MFGRFIECDACGVQMTTETNMSKKVMGNIARKQYGWSIGKYHLCSKCKNDKLSKQIVKENENEGE